MKPTRRPAPLVATLLAACLLTAGCGDEDGPAPTLFVDTGAPIAGAGSASVAWGRLSGALDLAVSGWWRDPGFGSFPFTDVYLNLTSFGLLARFPASGSVAWTDYNNNGELDLCIVGGPSGLYRGSSLTEEANALLPDFYGSSRSQVWGDYDNDGDLDLLITASLSGALVCRNDGGGVFTEDAGAALPGVLYSSLACGDYDNDGDLDVALAGATSDDPPDPVSKVYRNDGGTFTEETNAVLPGLYRCTLAWGDYDNDGDLDLALAGRDAAGDLLGAIYRNDGGGDFVQEANAVLVGVEFGSLAWGDYDNDGDLDLLLAGEAPDYVGNARLYRNDGGGSFAEVANTGLPALHHCSVAWGDCDFDGDLDVALAGNPTLQANPTAGVYRNDAAAAPNTRPAAPSGLGAAVSGSEPGPYDVTFTWASATDAETPQAGLSYNLRVGTTSGGNQVLPSLSDGSGLRLVPARGPVQPGLSVNEWTLRGLPAGTYYWSVQAVDTAFAGSPWAAQETVVVPPP